jgi:threonine dehydratase
VSGIAIAVKSQRPEIEVIGVQVETCAPVRASLEAGAPVEVDSALTIADGIAVKRPGELTLGLIRRWVDDIVVVAEDDVAEAICSRWSGPSWSLRAPGRWASPPCSGAS